MAPKPGTIALMGSGELTATMVEVYKELLAKLQPSPRAVFLDTPAGFQLNADLLSQKAVGYFHDRIQQSLRVVSFKSRDGVTLYEAEQAFHELREANFVLIGPGSPTYAVRNWDQTPVPEILTGCVAKGGCLVAASAAALTVGHFTLPVYEIYKVGQDLHWEEGLQILGHFGFNLVVVPHWNNAEGGTHDTRFCYMGAARFAQLEALLPDDIAIFGLDEHTACLLDLETDEAVVKGLGRAVLRCRGAEVVFEKGERFSLELLRGGKGLKPWQPIAPQLSPEPPRPGERQHSFWGAIHSWKPPSRPRSRSVTRKRPSASCSSWMSAFGKPVGKVRVTSSSPRRGRSGGSCWFTSGRSSKPALKIEQGTCRLWSMR